LFAVFYPNNTAREANGVIIYVPFSSNQQLFIIPDKQIGGVLLIYQMKLPVSVLPFLTFLLKSNIVFLQENSFDEIMEDLENDDFNILLSFSENVAKAKAVSHDFDSGAPPSTSSSSSSLIQSGSVVMDEVVNATMETNEGELKAGGRGVDVDELILVLDDVVEARPEVHEESQSRSVVTLDKADISELTEVTSLIDEDDVRKDSIEAS